jgi:thioredoxin 1
MQWARPSNACKHNKFLFKYPYYYSIKRQDMSTLSAITDHSFEQDVIQSSVPVLVDFWAAWCGPCKAIGPMLEDVAGSYAGKIKVVKMDVDQNTETPPKFGVRGIPTLILFKDGQAVATQVGLLSKPELMRFIDAHAS